jgi:hypothetical protein
LTRQYRLMPPIRLFDVYRDETLRESDARCFLR